MTKLVAILNLTPDSFSDGGLHTDPHASIKRMREEGADIIDIGAESTRPGATPLTPEEEWQRLAPVLKSLPKAPFSIDTRHAATAQKSLAHGASWINDVSGFSDPAMVAAVKNTDCKLVVMHSLTVPADKSIVMADDADVVAEILSFAKARIAALETAGIARSRIIFDPGIGFGKTAAQSLTLLQHISALRACGVPLLIGHSRKSFLTGDRDTATLAISKQLIAQGIDYLRVHDVAAHRALL